MDIRYSGSLPALRCARLLTHSNYQRLVVVWHPADEEARGFPLQLLTEEHASSQLA